MKTVTVGLSKPNGQFKIFSEIIRFVERRDFSHTYIIIDDMVYHASKGMVHCVLLSNFNEKNECLLTYNIDLTQESFDSAFSFVKNTLGVKYGFDQIVGILIQKIFKQREPIIVNNSQRMVCSEFCARFLAAAGIGIDVPFDSVTPSDLNAFLENKYGPNKAN